MAGIVGASGNVGGDPSERRRCARPDEAHRALPRLSDVDRQRYGLRRSGRPASRSDVAILGNYDAADRHFRAAAALERDFRAPPLVARTLYWSARMLATRAQPGDLTTSAEQSRECLAIAERIGMTGLERQARELTTQISTAVGRTATTSVTSPREDVRGRVMR